MRRTLVLLSVGVSACSPRTGTGALQVLVEFDGSIRSQCVKVTATDTAQTRETAPLVLAQHTSPLVVGIVPEGMESTVTVQALGYADPGCTQRTSPVEASDLAEGTFGNPTPTVTVRLRVQAPDGGVDAGLDLDHDGSPQPEDCDDSRPDIYPGQTERCDNGLDDDCDSAVDCADRPACDGLACAGGGTCSNGLCRQSVETSCNDNQDNDLDGKIDCLDPDCLGMACSDGDLCTSQERCVADGGCEATVTTTCTTPPAPTECWSAVGTCLPDAGTCSYTPTTASCSDGLACTTNDTCAQGRCTGSAITCPPPPSSCVTGGACAEPSGACVYPPVPAGSGCSDSDNCTVNDGCDGDGGCAGQRVSCVPPSECYAFSNTCTDDGGCLFDATPGQACDGGAGLFGRCSAAGTCLTSVFPFPPSNFTDADMVPADGGAGFVINGMVTLNTTGTPTLSSGTLPPYTLITPTGGQETLLFTVNGFTLNGTLTLTGERPVIFAVVGDATVAIAGTLEARNGARVPADCGEGQDSLQGSGTGYAGGGGGGFGTAGARGGNAGTRGAGDGGVPNGFDTLVPLRGGCPGGSAAVGGTGGAAGGAVQLTVSGTLTISGKVGAPGRGGAGASDTTGRGGGGGGSGGGVLLEANTLNLLSSARVTANGGAGGEGSGGNAGQTGQTGLLDSDGPAAGGGNGSPGGGDGGNGGCRLSPPAVGMAGQNSGDGAGGGGGAVGRVRLNTSAACVIAVQAVISPAPSTNGGCP